MLNLIDWSVKVIGMMFIPCDTRLYYVPLHWLIRFFSLVNRMLCEVSLHQPIRYSDSDPVEKWLHDVLCLDVSNNLLRFPSMCPPPDQCQLFYVQRDTLFSYNRKTEEFLKHLVAIYVSSHYKVCLAIVWMQVKIISS